MRRINSLLIALLIIPCASVFAQDGPRLIDTLTYETQSGLPMAASKIYFSDSKFTFSGYGESNYTYFDGPKNTESGDLELYMTNMQRFVAYAAYRPKKWLVLYAEIFAEYLNDGSRERHFEFQPEVFADFLLSDKFNVRVGTHQVQLGYINNSDEPIMFYSVNRPEVERLIIPSTWIDLGVMTYGKINPDLKWSASLYQGLDPRQLIGATWMRRGRADALRFNFDGFTFNSSLKYTGIEKTELAINGLYSRMSDGNIRSNTQLMSSYVRNSYNNWTFMVLGATGRTDNAAGLYELTQNFADNNMGQVIGSNVYGYYAEVSFDMLSLFGQREKKADNMLFKGKEMKVPLFVRYERLNTHASVDPELETLSYSQSDLTAITVGLNFNPRKNIVLKTNYQFRDNKAPLANGQMEGNRFELGMGFIF